VTYEELSDERKRLQASGDLPEWFTTAGFQLFKEKYLYEAKGYRDTLERIAAVAASHTDDVAYWQQQFFEVMWSGWLIPSTPVLSNMGTPKGMPVSCSGQYIDDSIDGFYSGYKETALLTKYGFGTSGYLGDIRPRGTRISTGGKASGVVPVVRHFVQDMRDVAQGTSRRGAWAGYLPIDHGDFRELIDYLEANPDDLNIGWNIRDSFLDDLRENRGDARERFSRCLKVKATTGKGYFFFRDKVNRTLPREMFERGLQVQASNLCTEITLPSDLDHTFTCVLSSMNLEKYDEWMDTDAVRVATVFLDCVASEFIRLSEHLDYFRKARQFTIKSRALGLGTLGFHTYLQGKMIPFESFEAHLLNLEIFKNIQEKAYDASIWMGKRWGIPEWCSKSGRRNSHLIAIAPNTQSAIIAGGVSQGIEPIVANTYVQSTAAGEMDRVSKVFLKIAKEKGKWTDQLPSEMAKYDGSVQHLDWLSEQEKLVFKTAYEIDQRAILRLASTRQKYIDQAQSINLFFDANEDEQYIADIHREAFLDENIKSLYYMRTKAGVKASHGECIACGS
jgi:ribonucleoside-diphosphate reductase alpha chain